MVFAPRVRVQIPVFLLSRKRADSLRWLGNPCALDRGHGGSFVPSRRVGPKRRMVIRQPRFRRPEFDNSAAEPNKHAYHLGDHAVAIGV